MSVGQYGLKVVSVTDWPKEYLCQQQRRAVDSPLSFVLLN
jgi:uncharacterized lipoprotein YbaY